MRGLNIIKYPSGRFGFVGRVPLALAFEGSAEDCETAARSGPRIARLIAEREGRVFRELSWDTEADARAAADAAGFPLT